jgi:hypothetical protein
MEADMNKKILFSASFLALLAVMLTVGIALAHTTVHAGNYEIEVGWLDEPALVGQRNAVVVNVLDTTDEEKEVDVSKLQVNVTYGGETKPLTIQPLSEDAKNQYIAPILPTIPGEYTVQLRGKIGDTDVNLDVQPEEVAAADTLAFPSAPAAGQRGAGGGLRLGDWIAIGALVIALAALVLGVIALRKTRS